MSGSIRDGVAIVGMGCTRFGELRDKSASDLVYRSVNNIANNTMNGMIGKNERSLLCHSRREEALWC